MASIKKQQGARGLSYKITVSAGRDAQEYQIRHYKTWKPPDGMTEKQADKEVKKIAYEFEAEVKAGFAPDNRATFAEYAAYVYSLAEQKGDKPQTLARWQTQLKRINGYIGTMKVTAIKPQHLNNLYKTWSKQGASRWRVYAAPVVDFRELVGGGHTPNLRCCAACMPV